MTQETQEKFSGSFTRVCSIKKKNLTRAYKKEENKIILENNTAPFLFVPLQDPAIKRTKLKKKTFFIDLLIEKE